MRMIKEKLHIGKGMHKGYYIIHPFVLVGCVFAAELLPVSPLLRLLIVCVFGIPSCFIVATGFQYILKQFGVKV